MLITHTISPLLMLGTLAIIGEPTDEPKITGTLTGLMGDNGRELGNSQPAESRYFEAQIAATLEKELRHQPGSLLAQLEYEGQASFGPENAIQHSWVNAWLGRTTTHSQFKLGMQQLVSRRSLLALDYGPGALSGYDQTGASGSAIGVSLDLIPSDQWHIHSGAYLPDALDKGHDLRHWRWGLGLEARLGSRDDHSMQLSAGMELSFPFDQPSLDAALAFAQQHDHWQWGISGYLQTANVTRSLSGGSCVLLSYQQQLALYTEVCTTLTAQATPFISGVTGISLPIQQWAFAVQAGVYSTNKQAFLVNHIAVSRTF